MFKMSNRKCVILNSEYFELIFGLNLFNLLLICFTPLSHVEKSVLQRSLEFFFMYKILLKLEIIIEDKGDYVTQALWIF